MRRIVIVLTAVLVPAFAARAPGAGAVGARARSRDRAATAAAAEQAAEPRVEELEKRVQKLERDAALDRLQFSGDYRFEAHTVDASIPDHFDGLKLQSQLVNTLFYVNATGRLPGSLNVTVNGLIQRRYADYLFFTQNLTFDQLRQAVGQAPLELQQQLFGLLMPSTFVPAYAADNKILYTNRLRLRFEAKVADNVSFSGRLGMYKVWGATPPACRC